MRDSVPALIKQLEWCEDDCRSIIDALARAGDPAALEPLSAKLADPVLADSAAGAMATIATRAVLTRDGWQELVAEAMS